MRLLLVRPEGRYRAVDGLRAISILWVILLHCLVLAAQLNPALFVEMRARLAFAWLRWGPLGVDIFFAISGFLIASMLFSECRRKGRIDVFRFYTRRAVRLLPAYYAALLIGVAAGLPNAKNLWANIVYVNNYLGLRHQFMAWTWSLAVEEHFYILFPLLVAPLLACRRPMAILMALLVLGAAIRAAIIAIYDPALAVPLGSDALAFFFDTLYGKTHVRYGSILIGVVVAYLNICTDVPARLAARPGARWLLSGAAAALLVPVAILPEMTAEIEHAWYVMALKVFLHMMVAAGVGCIILSTLAPTATPGMVDRFLSAPAWFPIAQVSYSAYLIHPFALALCLPLLRRVDLSQPGQVGSAAAFAVALAMTAAALIAAAVFHVLIERPALDWRDRLRARPSSVAAEEGAA